MGVCAGCGITDRQGTWLLPLYRPDAPSVYCQSCAARLWDPDQDGRKKGMGNKTRRSRDNGTTEAHGYSPAEEARQSYAEAGQVPEAHGGEETEGYVVEFENGSTIKGVSSERAITSAEDDVVTLTRDGARLATADPDFGHADSALKRLVTEPGETWVLETEESPEGAMQALAAWSQTRGVTLLVFGPGERFSLLSTKPGDTVVLFTANPAALNADVLTAWAQSRGLQLAVMPNEAALQHLDDATLEQMGLQRKNRVLVFPGGAPVPPNLKGPV